LQEAINQNSSSCVIADYCNKLEWKLTRSIVEENNTNLTINTTKAMKKTNIAKGMILVQPIHKEEQEQE